MPKRSEPTFAWNIIAGGPAFQPGGKGAGWLGGCLGSIAPVKADQLIVVDSGIGEEGARVIQEHSALRVKDGLPPVELIPFIWVDDFSKARNEALRLTKTDYMAWIDADDVLRGAENLRPIIKDIDGDESFIGTWHPYWYSRDGNGNVNTVHIRERIVRMSTGWEWKHRIHEALTPISPGRWFEDTQERLVWEHQRPPEPQAERNVKLLFLEYADDPSPRTVRAIGDQYFAGGEWEKAADWYERFYVDTRALLPERWQALCYASRCLRFLRDYEGSLRLAKMAVEMMPYWNDGYLQMASAYAATGEWGKAAYWAEHAKKQEKPISFLIHNPVEDGAEANFQLHLAYTAMERYDKALACAEEAYRWLPDNERLKKNIEVLKEAVSNTATRDSFLALAKTLSDKGKLALWRQMDGVGKNAAIRDVTIPILLRQVRRGTQPEVTIFCGQSLEQWTAKTPTTTGIGGSETAVIEVSRRLARDGYRVLVYNDCGVDEGIQDGVAYVDWRRWRFQNKTDVFVAWRMTYEEMAQTKARAKWLWLHDLNRQLLITEKNTGFVDKVFGVSTFHADYLKQAYPFLAERVGFLNNGINLERFQQQVKRQDFKVAWTSSPDRGLLHLLAMWPHIVKAEPAAELHVFYGWDNIDKLLGTPGYEGLAMLKQTVLGMMEKTPSVKWRGRVDQNILAEELLSSQVWAYPTSFVETFCIGALEAMAAGCHIVSSDLGNIPNVVGDAGLLIPGHPQTKSYQYRFTGILMGFLADVGMQLAFRGKGQERAKGFTWDAAYGQWKAELALALERTKVAA